jgi:hypothetical protein
MGRVIKEPNWRCPCGAVNTGHPKGCWRCGEPRQSKEVCPPEPLVLHCPRCGLQHVDEGEWATRAHKTHLCAGCGQEWRPKETATVGVAAQRSKGGA